LNGLIHEHDIHGVGQKSKAPILREMGAIWTLILAVLGLEFCLVLFYGTTACEKPLLEVVFVFEHFFYSSATAIL